MSGGKGSLRRSYDVKKYSDNYDKIFGKNKLTCSCGGGDGPNHILGEGKCFRKLATGSLIPTNFHITSNELVLLSSLSNDHSPVSY